MVAVTRELTISYGTNRVASVANVGGFAVYTISYADGSTVLPAWITVGTQIIIRGCTNGSNNGVFTVTAVAGLTVTTNNATPVVESSPSTANLGFVVGGASERQTQGVLFPDDAYDIAGYEFRFLATGATEAAFVAECLSCEEAFRIPRQDFVILQGQTVMKSLKQSDNTGLDASPKIIKQDAKSNTGRSRIYKVRIEIGRPANNLGNADASGQPGLRYATINVEYGPQRKRRVTITGAFTAVSQNPTDGARARYTAKIDAYCASVLTGLGLASSARELVAEPRTESNVTDKVMEFQRIYDEIIYSQAGGSLDDSAIKRQNLRIARDKVGPGDTPTANRLVTVTVSYEAWIDKDVSQDLKGKYDGQIRSWLVGQAQTSVGAGMIALISDKPEYHFDENKITASMTLQAALVGGAIENRITVEDAQPGGDGVVLTPGWDGDPLAKYDYQGPRVQRRTITQVTRFLSGGAGSTDPSSGGGGGGGAGPPNVGGGGFSSPGGGFVPVFQPHSPGALQGLLDLAFGNGNGNGAGQGGGGGSNAGGLSSTVIDHRQSRTPLTLGIDSWKIPVVDITDVTVIEYYKPISQGGGPGGTPTGAGAPVASGPGR